MERLQHRGMEPIGDALARLGLAERVRVIPVPSGYPAPKFVQLVAVHDARGTWLFETSSGDAAHVQTTREALAAHGITRLDGIFCTHTHGDHAGGAEALSRLGRTDGSRAPVHLHSSGHRMITSPGLAFLDESFDIMVVRSHRMATSFEALFAADEHPKQLRAGWQDRYARIPRSALSFVDRGGLPPGVVALHVPGHADDCVVYLHEETGVAIPGDTVLTSGRPDDPASFRCVVPPFTVVDQKYSRGVESYLVSLGRLRRFFETCDVRIVIPPHGRLAVVRPLVWWETVVAYFEAIYRALCDDVLGDADLARGFGVAELGTRITHPQAEPMSVNSHLYGLCCLLVEEGALDADEDPRTRQIRFTRRGDPPRDLVERLVNEDRSPLRILRCP